MDLIYFVYDVAMAGLEKLLDLSLSLACMALVSA
jgi:hypothetical protein